MAEEDEAAGHAESTGHAAKGILGKIIAAHLGPLPLPLVIAGGVLALILGYEYYKNRGAGSTAAAPVAVPVGGVPSGGSSGGNGGGSSAPDYSGQLASLGAELTGLQSSLTGVSSALAAQQAALSGLQAQIPASLAAAQAPAANPIAPAPLPAYTPAISAITNPFAQQSNLAPASSSAYQQFYDQHFLPGGSAYNLPTAQTSYGGLYQNPIAYTGPTQSSGYNIPVYNPLPQYSTALPYVQNPYYSTGQQITTTSGLVPSTPYGFAGGTRPASVAGHYVELAGGGGQIWVPG